MAIPSGHGGSPLGCRRCVEVPFQSGRTLPDQPARLHALHTCFSRRPMTSSKGRGDRLPVDSRADVRVV